MEDEDQEYQVEVMEEQDCRDYNRYESQGEEVKKTSLIEYDAFNSKLPARSPFTPSSRTFQRMEWR